jgi:hypothetical protein
MSARLRPFAHLFGLAFVLEAAAGCSLFCTFNGLKQPCDTFGDCLPGYQCVANVCVAGGGDGGGENGDGGNGDAGEGTGCTSDLSCPAGACASSVCIDLPLAWDDGAAQKASLDSCYPWPPPPASGNPAVPLSGCVVIFPGDDGTGLADAGATVSVLEANNMTIVPATAVVLNSKCLSGIGYKVSVPPGQLLDVVVTAQGWATTYNQAVELPGDAGSGDRDVGVLSANGWSQKLTAVTSSLDLPIKAQDALEVGIVRDCSGNPMSGVSLQGSQPGDGGIAIAYLDSTGTPIAGRTATDSSGLFAAVALPDTYTLSFLAANGTGSETLASILLVVTAQGSGWIDLAPLGP